MTAGTKGTSALPGLEPALHAVLVARGHVEWRHGRSRCGWQRCWHAVKPLDSDKAERRIDDNEPGACVQRRPQPGAQDPLAFSVTKRQLGVSAGLDVPADPT